jgi:uncharacterized integral membrane protein (TIGR00697 family)
MTNNTGKLILLTGLFVTALIAANIIAAKLFVLGSAVLTVGIITYPITFLLTDTISEVWGKKRATQVVWMGFLANIFMLGVLYIARILPPAPFWPHQEAFDLILGAVPRIVIASLVAYIVSQTHDVWSFHFWRHKTGGKHLWLRNNVSTMTSQLIDSVIFVTVAFYGSMPNDALVTMIITQYMVKLVIAVLDTPFCYMLVSWAKR